MFALALNRHIPLRHRIFLGYCVGAWMIGPLQHVGLVLFIGAMLDELNTSPLTIYVLPLWALNIAYIFWMYWEGLKINANVSADCRRRWWEPICMVLLLPLFSLWEGLGGFLGFLRVLRGDEKSFVVIKKPA